MSERSKREKEAFLNKISQECNESVTNAIEECFNLSKSLGLGKPNIPNITIYYHNKLISLEKDFANASIDFFDDRECACYIIIRRNFDMLLIQSIAYLNNYANILKISKEQIVEYIDSFKKPRFFDMVFKGSKYSPKKSILTDKQISDSKLCIKKYVSYCNQIDNFSIPDDIVKVFKQYYIYSTISGKKISDEFVSRIDTEIQKLGYASIKSTLDYEMQILDICSELYLHIPNLISD